MTALSRITGQALPAAHVSSAIATSTCADGTVGRPSLLRENIVRKKKESAVKHCLRWN
ncbi:hypothetical protein [Cupriavidus consociatus]|uniref:hypothetical protein n=1 Tax=Cupriavidus consociatus TaxID=2821357 RepID=UPI001AE26627|nr:MULTISPECIES: hypothetical protein [unclassified Cupriavidus]MBP0625278.1 hypothetical protein [Cupriavidus sp. LEh25]MDK2662015.1 hypothetical protein [Cupriavidus sp. LEh21]